MLRSKDILNKNTIYHIKYNEKFLLYFGYEYQNYIFDFDY